MKYVIQNKKESSGKWQFYAAYDNLKDANKRFIRLMLEYPKQTIRLFSTAGDTNIPFEIIEYREGKNQ